MRSINILHIIDSGGMYGAEAMLLNLAREQIKLGDTPVIASIGTRSIVEKPIEREAIKRGIAVKKIRTMSGPNIISALKILRYAQKNKIDIFHSHGYKGNILMGIFPKFIRKIPLVTTLHGYTSTSGFSRMKIYEMIDGFMHRYFDAVVIVNKGMLTHPNLRKRKHLYSTIINNGIPVDYPDDRITESCQKKDLIQEFVGKRLVIGAIGRLSLEKGFKYLIEAFSMLAIQVKEICLVIIGEGNQEQALMKMVRRYNIEKQVLMTGYINNAKELLPCFDIFVIPSLTEGLPITLLDAMLAKVPVVCADVGGIPDVLDNGEIGILIKPGDAGSLKNALQKLISNSELAKKMTKKAFEKIVDCYSSKKMALEYQALYKRI